MSKFHDIILPIADLLDRKNTDYGDSYRHLREEFGPTSFIIRLMDKVNRVKQLTKADALVKSESLQDTIKDIIGYCALELRYLDSCAPDTDAGSKDNYCLLRKSPCYNEKCSNDDAHYRNQCWSNLFCHHMGEPEKKVEKRCDNCGHYYKNVRQDIEVKCCSGNGTYGACEKWTQKEGK